MPDQITMNELIHLVKEQAQKIVMLEEKIGKLELETGEIQSAER